MNLSAIVLLFLIGVVSPDKGAAEQAVAEAKSAVPALNFKSALAEMNARSTQVENQRAVLAQTRARHVSGRAGWFPSLAAVATDSQLQRPRFQQIQTGRMIANMNLFHSGSDLALWKSGSSAVDREQFRLLQTELEVEENNLVVLVQYIQSAMQVRVDQNILRLNTEMADTESARYNRGLIPLQESQKAVIEKNNSMARLQDSQARHEEIRASLVVQLGQADVDLNWPGKMFLNRAAAEAWVRRDFQLEQSPAWRAAIENVESEDQFQASRFRDFLPSLDLTVGYGYQDYMATRQPGWDTLLTLTIPLFDLKKHGDYRIAVQQKNLARVAQEDVKRRLTKQWRETKEKLMLTLQSVIEREQSVKMAQSLYQDNLRRLRAGRSNMNDIVVDQNRLAAAETVAINGWAEAHILYSRLCHTLGLRVNLDAFGCL